MKYRIKNWSRYQHYKDRNPPWIKLHFELLNSEDWVMLADASRVLAVASMLVASRTDGKIDVSEKGKRYMKRIAYLNEVPDFKPLIDVGFLVADVETLADASTMQADARPETETETEKEKDFKPKKSVPVAEIVEIYNRGLGEHPKATKVVKIDSELRRNITARWNDAEGHQRREFWEWYFERCEKTFLFADDNDRKTGLRTLVRNKNFWQIVEGSYDRA